MFKEYPVVTEFDFNNEHYTIYYDRMYKEMLLTNSHFNECWMCGKKIVTTKHHVLPKRVHPNFNLLIPLCDVCHRSIHDLLPYNPTKDKKIQKYINKIVQNKVDGEERYKALRGSLKSLQSQLNQIRKIKEDREAKYILTKSKLKRLEKEIKVKEQPRLFSCRF